MANLYIFLDIDGVLNTKSEWNTPYALNNSCIKIFCDFVNTINLKHPAKIILTSSWREGFDASGNHLPQIHALINKMNAYYVSISGKTPKSPNDDRLREIQYFLSRNAQPSDLYIIIDDDKTLFTFKDDSHFYFTDCNKGFNEHDKKLLLNKIRKMK